MKSKLNTFPDIGTIGELPSSYLISMTYEEQLLWIGNYLQKTVVPKTQELIEITNKILTDYENIDEYVAQKLEDFMDELTTNIETITETIINQKIAGGEIQISLGETYDSEDESLTLFIQTSASDET